MANWGRWYAAMTRMRVDLTPQELALVPLCEQAIAEGRTLADWCAANEPSYRKIALDPGRKCSLPHRGEAFFGDIEIAGGMRSVMGCRQHMWMGRAGEARSVADVREFVMRDFLADANDIDRRGVRHLARRRRCGEVLKRQSGHEAARVLPDHRRCGGCLAVRGTRAAPGPCKFVTGTRQR
jgi:hypothetical protein